MAFKKSHISAMHSWEYVIQEMYFSDIGTILMNTILMNPKIILNQG